MMKSNYISLHSTVYTLKNHDQERMDPFPALNPWEYLLDAPHNLAWCNVFKAASSSWMWIFNILAGYDEEYLRDPKNTHVRMKPRHSTPACSEISAIEHAF